MTGPVQIYKLEPLGLVHGIILRQVSPESLAIFDFILELYSSCDSDWHQISEVNGVTEDLRGFLEYAATFLSNIGNYYVCD